MFSHEKLKVYQCSTEFLGLSSEIISDIPKGNADLLNQLRRAALSIPLNIAEGAGKTSRLDKRRFYSIARGSTLECAAILDALIILELAKPETIDRGKILLKEIAAMLTALVLKWGNGKGNGQVQAQG